MSRILNEALTGEVPTEDIEVEKAKIAKEISNLVKAVAAGGDIPKLVGALQEKKRELAAVERRLAARVERPDRKRLRESIEQRCTEWKDILRLNMVAARHLIKEMVGALQVHSEPVQRWVVRGQGTMGSPGLRGSVRPTVHQVASPTGLGQFSKLSGQVAA